MASTNIDAAYGSAATRRAHEAIRRCACSILALALAAFGIGPPSLAATLVPPGNRYAEQPDVPGASAKRTQALKTTFEAKYRKVYALLKNDAKLRAKISSVSAEYGIDPMHIVGAIVGEHTYNVDAYDRLQTYYVKAVSYLSSRLLLRL